MRGIHRGPVDSPQKGPVTRKLFPFDDVTMRCKIARSAIVEYLMRCSTDGTRPYKYVCHIIIAVTSYGRHCVLNHRNVLFNNMFWLAKEKTSKLCITGYLCWKCWKFSTIWTSYIHVHVLYATCVRPPPHPPGRASELRRQYSPSPDGKRVTNTG